MIVSSLVAVYYNMILAWSLFYVFATLINASELPWANCDSSWNTYRTLLHIFIPVSTPDLGSDSRTDGDRKYRWGIGFG